jgi:hypothetical protein
MTRFAKSGRLWIALATVAIGAVAAQAVYAQVNPRPVARPVGLDPFNPVVVSGGQLPPLVGSPAPSAPDPRIVRRPPTRDPVRPPTRSPFIP